MAIDFAEPGGKIERYGQEYGVIEAGTSKELKLIYTPSGENNCWGDYSEIFISCESKKVTLYLNGVPLSSEEENMFYKKDLDAGELTLTANAVSASWDEVAISVKGTPISDNGSCSNNGSGSSSTSAHRHETTDPTTFNIVVYEITMSVKEKPWGGTWNEVEDQGTYQTPHPNAGRSWYHFWQENENAIMANVAPSFLVEVVTDTTFGGLSATDFTPSSRAPAQTVPKWKEILSGVNFYPGVTASAFVGAVELKGTQSKVDIMVNDIQKPIWEENTKPKTIQGSGSSSGSTSGNDIHLAKVDQNNPPENGGGWRIFREQDEPGNKPLFNRIRLNVSLAQVIPPGMWASIYLKVFDPANPLLKGVPISAFTAGEPNDNCVPWAFSEKKWTYQENQQTYGVYCAIPSGQPGDNYIVAVHPDQGAVDKYRFYNESDGASYDHWGSTLMRPTTSTAFEELNTKLQSPLLTVWRTLWFELDRMAPPEEGVGDTNKFDPAVKYTPGVSGDRGDITKNQWMDGTEDEQPVNEPHDFDIKFQPSLPGLTRTTEQFKRACIDARGASSDQIKQWSGKPTLTLSAFVKHLDPGDIENSTVTIDQIGRDIPLAHNKDEFWIIHVLGAYNPASDFAYDTTGNWMGGYATSISALIYNEALRDMVNTGRWIDPKPWPDWVDSNTGKLPWVSLSEARSRLVLHEVLHYFLWPHGTYVITNQGIMNTNLGSWRCFLYTTGTHELDRTQIGVIQRVPRPTQTG